LSKDKRREEFIQRKIGKWFLNFWKFKKILLVILNHQKMTKS